MKRYIALLRGINVSGLKKIKMAELREQLVVCGFKNIQTYIQSGNIIFDSEVKDTAEIELLISDRIKEIYDFDVETVVLSPEYFKIWTDSNPFINRGDCDITKLYYTILKSDPSTERINLLNKVSYPPEEFILDGRMVYLHTPEGSARAKLSNNFIESKLKVPATTRNHRTMLKLYEMAIPE